MAAWSLGFAHHGGVVGSLYGLGKRGLAKRFRHLSLTASG